MAKNKLLKGNRPDIISLNVKTLKDAGYEHNRAVRCAMCHANKKHGKHAQTVAKKVTKKSEGVGLKEFNGS
jgi:hypothetical protein